MSKIRNKVYHLVNRVSPSTKRHKDSETSHDDVLWATLLVLAGIGAVLLTLIGISLIR